MEIGEAPPVADKASRFRGSGTIGAPEGGGNRNAATVTRRFTDQNHFASADAAYPLRVKSLRRFLLSLVFDEREESLLEAVLLAQAAGFGELFDTAAACAVAAEHQIFGRVGEVDELDDIDVVALVL